MEPEKVYNPQEPVAITLTKEQWGKVLNCITNDMDYHKAKRWECIANIKSEELAAEWAAIHEKEAAKAESLIKTIEGFLYPAPEPETE